MTFWRNRKTLLYVDFEKNDRKFLISNDNNNFTFANGYVHILSTLLHILNPKGG